MFLLKRQVRVKDVLGLPDGGTLEVSLNVETYLKELVVKYRAVVDAAQPKDGELDRAAFYRAYVEFLKEIFDTDFPKLEAVFEGDLVELCDVVSPWVTQRVLPAIAEASKKRARQR